MLILISIQVSPLHLCLLLLFFAVVMVHDRSYRDENETKHTVRGVRLCKNKTKIIGWWRRKGFCYRFDRFRRARFVCSLYLE